jgi:hypothetical protein
MRAENESERQYNKKDVEHGGTTRYVHFKKWLRNSIIRAVYPVDVKIQHEERCEISQENS